MWRRLSIAALSVTAALAVAFYGLVYWPLRNPHPLVRLSVGLLAIRDAKIYPSPDVPPLERATVLVRDGRVIAVGTDVSIPPGAQMIPCDHCVVTAGFWNAHVHFTEPKWSFADWRSSDTLNRQLADMLTSRGFRTVVDVGSDLRVGVCERSMHDSRRPRDLQPPLRCAGAGVGRRSRRLRHSR